jgi:hypothetical protein
MIGAHQALILMASTERDKQRPDLAQQEGFGLVLFAPLAVRVLDRMGVDVRPGW